MAQWRTMTAGPPLHPAVRHLAPLLGTWVGGGEGHYPTIESFSYSEELTFGHVGKPFLTMTQRTRATDDGRPLHAEAGYLRPDGDAGAELVVAHPMGHVELSLGRVEVTANRLWLELGSTTLAGTPTAKEVTGVRRSLELVHDGSASDDELITTLAMAAVGQPMQPHLRSVLRRSATSSP